MEKYKPQKEPLLAWLKAHGTASKWSAYAINKAGQLGILQIPHNLKKKIDNLAKNLESEYYPKNIAKDKKVPIKFNGRVGVFLCITRTGKASPTSDDVKINMIEVGDDGAKAYDFHYASDELLAQAKETLPCLVKMINDTTLTIDQVQQLVDNVRENNGISDPDFVDKVMGVKTQNKPESSLNNDDPFADGIPGLASEAVTKAETPSSKAEETKAESTKPPETQKDSPTIDTKESAVINAADVSDDQFDSLFND